MIWGAQPRGNPPPGPARDCPGTHGDMSGVEARYTLLDVIKGKPKGFETHPDSFGNPMSSPTDQQFQCRKSGLAPGDFEKRRDFLGSVFKITKRHGQNIDNVAVNTCVKSNNR